MTMQRVFLAWVLAVAQPVAAIQTIDWSPSVVGDRVSECVADDPQCTAANAEADGEPIGDGPIIAGLAGLIVLGLVFGRRKSGLPEVVS